MNRIAKLWNRWLLAGLLLASWGEVAGQTLILDCPADTLFCIQDNSCETTIGIPPPEAFTSCASGNVSFSYSAGSLGTGALPQNGLALPNIGPGVWSVELTATDDCGNEASCAYNLTVLDCQPPTANCTPALGADLNPDGTLQLWATDFNLGSTDNCGPVSFSFSADQSDLHREFSCEGLGVQTLEIWVHDLAGNTSTCETELTLSPGAADCPVLVTLSGTIFQLNSEPAPGITVLLEGDQQEETLTDAAGKYSFSVASGGNFRVRPCAGGGLINGVSTLDLALLQLHILGQQPLTSPYSLIRADVNNDGAIDPLDMADLRKLVLGSSTSFPNNTPWRFVPNDYNFPDPLDPFQPPFPEIRTFQPTGDIFDADFFILKTGDLAASTLLPTEGECAPAISQLSGQVFYDENEDCLPGAGEVPLAGRIVRISGDGIDRYTRTLADGRYSVVLPPGTYQVEVVSTQAVWVACAAQEITLAAGEKETLDVGLQAANNCAWLQVSVATGLLTPCETHAYQITYENKGSETAFATQLVLQIDPWMTLESSDLPWTTPDGVQYFFELGDLGQGQTGNFFVNLSLSCDAMPGQTHRVEARIGPDYLSCLPPNPSWDGASLHLDGQCVQDTVRFELRNDGAPMLESVNFIVIEDDMIMRSEPLQLGSGEIFHFDWAGAGATYRLSTEQTPGHPGMSRPTLALEGCGTDGDGSFSTGFVGVFPEDEGDDFISISVLESIQDPLPFFKEAYPIGYREKHFIEAGEYLDYQIRFQNTGNDTVSVVAVIDSISQQLDWATFEPGAASHPYTVKMIPGVGVAFLMKNMALPPAGLSPDASRGFVSFRIRTREDLPDGEYIRNPAEVFFDNQPTATIITSYHTIGSNFVEMLPVGISSVPVPKLDWKLYPNPAKEEVRLTLSDAHSGFYTLQIRDLLGRLLHTETFTDTDIILKRENLPAGIYYFTLESDGQYLGVRKVVFCGPGNS